ncbi:MAG: hypothetical protein IPK83_11400 [Planctomycetes bacterium]|nr:hypothetical protein [Planctomycetota bacterium]
MNLRQRVTLLVIGLTSIIVSTAAHAHYSPRLGRFISRDPIGERGGFNLQASVANRPTDLVDPIGLDIYVAPNPGFKRQCQGTCGADITDWFKDEMVSQRKGWDAYKAQYEKQAGVGIGYFQYSWWSYHNHYYKTWEPSTFVGVGGAVGPPAPSGNHQYRFNQSTKCGQPPKGGADKTCGNTVTLCGKCIHSSVLGNLMFGMMANYAKQDLDEVTNYVREKIVKYGNDDPFDAPIYKVGFDSYGPYSDFGAGSDFCKKLLESARNQNLSLS